MTLCEPHPPSNTWLGGVVHVLVRQGCPLWHHKDLTCFVLFEKSKKWNFASNWTFFVQSHWCVWCYLKMFLLCWHKLIRSFFGLVAQIHTCLWPHNREKVMEIINRINLKNFTLDAWDGLSEHLQFSGFSLFKHSVIWSNRLHLFKAANGNRNELQTVPVDYLVQQQHESVGNRH